jgi:hypothetical protein
MHQACSNAWPVFAPAQEDRFGLYENSSGDCVIPRKRLAGLPAWNF